MQEIVTYRNMATLNSTPDGPRESSEKSSKTLAQNSHNLLKEAIFRELWNPLDPIKFNEYKKNRNTYNKAIETSMYDLRSERKNMWWDISDDMISSETTTTNIAETIARMGQNLILMRKRAFDRALELFPNIITQSNTWSRILDEAVNEMNESELKTLTTRTQFMRKMIHEIFPWLKWEIPNEKKDFETIFQGYENHFDDTGKARFVDIYRNYTKYGQKLSIDDVDFILEGYKNDDDATKKNILTALWVTLSIKQAFDLKLIDMRFIENLAQKELQDVYLTLEQEQRDSFLRGLRHDTTSIVAVSNFDPTALWEVFRDKRKRRILATEIARSLALDTPMIEEWPERTIETEIRKRKLKELDQKNLISEEIIPEEWDLFDEFVDEINARLRQKDGSPHIENIERLKTDRPIIRYTHENGTTQYVRIKNKKNIDVQNGGGNGIDIEGLTIVNGSLQKVSEFGVTYTQLESFLKEHKNISILEADEFDSLLTKDPEEAESSAKILDARDIIDEEPVTADNILAKIDLLDTQGNAYGFDVGTVFIAPVEYEDAEEDGQKTSSQEGVWTISQIDRNANTVNLIDPTGRVTERDLPIDLLYRYLAQTQWFQRIAKIANDDDMLKELWEYSKVGGKLKLNDKWFLLVEKTTDDGHGHKEKKDVPVNTFKSEKWGHIRLEYIKWGMVKFWEFDDGGNDPKKIKDYAEKHGLDKEIEGLYHWRSMSYASFIRYLEEEGLEASTDDPILPGKVHHDLGHEHHHAPHAHMEWSFLKRVMKWQNPASIWKWFEMIYHSIEHTLEKWAKLDAARFALGTSNFLWLPDAVSAQVYSDITTASKEIVEKYEQKIFGLPGPAWRHKCIHIVHNKDSRPEEVMSAINYMLKSYGHLYAEDIKHYQPKVTKKNLETAEPWYFAFFDWLVLTSKLGNLNQWRMKAYEKAITEMGSDEVHENEPTEEQLIHSLCKIIDGNWGDYPYAASIVKAIGWPGGFEKIWKFEGFDNAFKKWKDQTQMVNAQWRLNKSVWYLETHEIYKAVGAMESMAAKVKEPDFQAMPFIWAVWWYSKYASHAALQKLKWYAENGFSFHAYAFLRNDAGNIAYKNTVKLALKEIGGQSKVDEFEELCAKLEFNPDNEKSTKGAATAMMRFWQNNFHKWLHDMLQGNNGWLTAKAREWDETVQTYLKIFYGAHTMQLKDPSIPGTDYGMDWYKEHGYQNMIMAEGEDGLRSLWSMLNKIQYTTTNRWWKPMNKEHEAKIWNYVKGYLQKWLRDTKSFGGDSLQKEQFLYHRTEIIEHFAGQLSAGEITDPAIVERLVNAKEYSYFQDLAKLGIDPRSIFNAELREKNEDEDYKRWKDGRSVGESLFSQVSAPDIKASFQKKTATVMSGKTPTDTVKIKAGPRMKRKDWDGTKNVLKNTAKEVDDDLLYRGWSSYSPDDGSEA